MGYYTRMHGHFNIEPALTMAQKQEIDAYLKQCEDANYLPDDAQTVGIKWWCAWEVSEYGDRIVPPVDEFKDYDEGKWLPFLIEKFFQPWGCIIKGELRWSGEEDDDQGTIYADAGKVEYVKDIQYNPGPSWAKKGG